MSPWRTEKWLVLDTETTGVDVSKDRVVELGWVVFEAGKRLSMGRCLVNPGVPIPEPAQAVHGISDEQVAIAPRLEEVWQDLSRDLADCPVVAAYNWPYDSAILQRQLGEVWDEALFGKVVLDPLVMVRSVGKYWPGSGRHRLSNVCERYHIVPPGELHRAGADAWCAAMVMWRLRYSVPEDGFEAMREVAAWRVQQNVDREKYLAERRKPV